MKREFKIYILAFTALIMGGCEDLLDAPLYSEFAPENVLTNEKGIEALLFNAYRQQNPHTNGKNWINMFETATDIAVVSEGAEEGNVAPYRDWNWDANTPWLSNSLWEPMYRSIRDANLVIENINNFEGEADSRSRLLAEARFIRASSYSLLYNWFGPVVLRKESGEPVNKARASDEEMRAFIETELTAAAEDLPHPGALPPDYEYGRATRGTALAYLAKHYLNTRQWEQAAETALEVMNLGYYSLFPDFRGAFFVSNEGNREMIAVFPAINQQGYHSVWPNGVASPDFYSAPNIPEHVRDPQRMSAWATNFRVRDWIVDTMDVNDDRRSTIVDDYIDVSGAPQKYSDQRPDNRRSFKFFDPNGTGNFHGNDLPWIRYADILLTRAEALNELNQNIGEAKGLIKQVRSRAGLTDHSAVDAAAQGVALRDLILLERAKEFISEGKRREDLLRHDLYVANAQARGVALAESYKKVFPIPASEANNNNLIVQDEEYK